jgi:hypothetical protein
MTSSISDAVRRALTAADGARTNPRPTALAPFSVHLYRPPVLSHALTRELDRALAGATVLPGAGPDDGPMIVWPVLEWQPDAADAAEHLRAGMECPASREVVEVWLARLALMVANAPTDQVAAELQCGAVWELCSDLPVAVWSGESIKAYCDVEKYWPCPAELRQFLRSRAELIERQIAGFDRVAKAPRARSGPARESTVPYTPPAYLPPLTERHMPKSDNTSELREDERPRLPTRTVEQQFAAFGLEVGARDLLDARLGVQAGIETANKAGFCHRKNSSD